MTQSAMCIPLWPALNGNTAHLVMCPFAGGSSSAFRHWQAEQLADCALSLVTWPGRDRLRHLEPLRSITQLAAQPARPNSSRADMPTIAITSALLLNCAASANRACISPSSRWRITFRWPAPVFWERLPAAEKWC